MAYHRWRCRMHPTTAVLPAFYKTVISPYTFISGDPIDRQWEWRLDAAQALFTASTRSSLPQYGLSAEQPLYPWRFPPNCFSTRQRPRWRILLPTTCLPTPFRWVRRLPNIFIAFHVALADRKCNRLRLANKRDNALPWKGGKPTSELWTYRARFRQLANNIMAIA